MNYMEPNMEIIWLSINEDAIRTSLNIGGDLDEGEFEELEEVQ